MTKERGDASWESVAWTESVFITLGGPQAHDSPVGMTIHLRRENDFPKKYLRWLPK